MPPRVELSWVTAETMCPKLAMSARVRSLPGCNRFTLKTAPEDLVLELDVVARVEGRVADHDDLVLDQVLGSFDGERQRRHVIEALGDDERHVPVRDGIIATRAMRERLDAGLSRSRSRLTAAVWPGRKLSSSLPSPREKSSATWRFVISRFSPTTKPVPPYGRDG